MFWRVWKKNIKIIYLLFSFPPHDPYDLNENLAVSRSCIALCDV